MNSEFSLSLVVPSYNRATLIGETLDSALSQSSKFKEIIVVNDGSTDNTIEVLEEYKKYIRIITTKNQGVQAARNTGVNAATTSHITLCDSDDLLHTDYVATLRQWYAEKNEAKIVYCNFQTFDDKAVYTDKFSLAPIDFFAGAVLFGSFILNIPDLYLKTLKFQPLFCSGVTIDKNFYHLIGGFDTALRGVGAEDWEFTLRAIATGHVAVCAVPLVKVRKHNTNDSANSARQAAGEARVLEYALAHHEKAKEYRSFFLSEIHQIRLVAFERAFARADFGLAFQMSGLLTHHPKSLKHFAKLFITRLPPTPRLLAWKIATK